MESLIQWLENNMLSCPYKSMLGISCPGCGIQRSLIALLKGELIQSIYLYPALLPVIFTLLLTALHLVIQLKKGPELIKYSFIATSGIIVASYIYTLCI